MQKRLKRKLKPPERWASEQIERNIFAVHINLPKVGDEQWVLFQSDIHWDNPKCDRGMVKKHLDQAVERNAMVFRLGDQLDLMGGKYDPRRSKDAIMDQYNHGTYLRDVMEDYAEFHRPYANMIVYEGLGNHEMSVEDHLEFPVLHDTCTRMGLKAGCEVAAGGYTNWTKFYLWSGGAIRKSLVMWQTHGYGGGGPVTKDIIQASRQGVFLEGVDIVASGHTHDEWKMPQATVRLNDNLNVVHGRRLHIKCPTYKQAWNDGARSWEVSKGHPPKPMGGVWLRIWCDGREDGVYRYHYDSMSAL